MTFSRFATVLGAAMVALGLTGSAYALMSPEQQDDIRPATVFCQELPTGKYYCSLKPEYAYMSAGFTRYVLDYTADGALIAQCTPAYCLIDRAAFNTVVNGHRTDVCAPYACPPADACSKSEDGVERCLFELS